MLLQKSQILNSNRTHLKLVHGISKKSNPISNEPKFSSHEVANFLGEIDRRLDDLDKINSETKNGPLSLLLCNLESFCLGVEVDRKISVLNDQVRAKKLQCAG